MHFPIFFRGCLSNTSNHFLLLGTMKLSNNSLIEKQVTITFFLVEISPAPENVCLCVHLRAGPAQPCCGDGSCVFPACHGGRAGGRRGGVEGEASAGPGCGGSEGRELPGETLEETPHGSCINWLG